MKKQMIKDITQRLLFFLGRKLYTIYHFTSERIASCRWRLQDVIKHKHMYLSSRGPCNFLSLALRLHLVWTCIRNGRFSRNPRATRRRLRPNKDLAQDICVINAAGRQLINMTHLQYNDKWTIVQTLRPVMTKVLFWQMLTEILIWM